MARARRPTALLVVAGALVACSRKREVALVPVVSPAPVTSTAVAPAPARETFAVQLVATEEAFCARAESGGVYCWGYGARGELGNGSIDTRRRPVRVEGIRRASRLAASGNRVCAIEGGRVLCWGADLALVPKAVGDESDVVDLAVGFPHVCMIHADRRVTCRALYPRLSDAATPRDSASPASAIVGKEDDSFATETPSGVVAFRHATIASGAAPLGTEKRPGPLAKPASRVTNAEGSCELRDDGIVSCETGRVPIGEPVAARAQNTLAVELQTKDARVVAARLREDGALSMCVALPRHRYPWVLTNRQCFVLDEASGTFRDEPAWTPESATASFVDGGIEVQTPDGTKRRVNVPVLAPDGDVALEASRSGHAAVGTSRDPTRPLRTVAFYDLETGKQLWRRVQPTHLDEWFYATDDFVVHVFTDENGNDGHWSIELTSRAGARVKTAGDSAIEAADESDMATHKGFSEASARHVATWSGPVTLHAIDAPRDVTGMKAPPSSEILLYDPKKRRIFALSDEPLGSVTIFDRAEKKVVFTGAPGR